MEYIVVIIAFIVGGLISHWISTRNAPRRHDEAGRGDEAGRAGDAGEQGHAQPGWQQPPRAPRAAPVRLPPLAQAVLRYFPVTTAFIAICVVIAVVTSLGQPGPLRSALQIAASRGAGLDDILSGEAWRLLTPIFLHFGPLHLLFNMFMLWDLGRVVEHFKGSRFVLAFTVAVGIGSNLAQYLLTGNPNFGGMSGVLYGLFGYVWMQGKYNPRFGITLTQHTVVMMLGWFALCWTGLLGPIANWAHTGGLLLGAGWGYFKRYER